ncbi:hypothetical protein VNO78_34199 [Psophocarpus tetragonolobus]|uniref:Uncharacterized protein n=1 Tax=Psophocarpus tetragonolobus TaxID=3891 RepID=A0AAN9RS26_PSOTE
MGKNILETVEGAIDGLTFLVPFHAENWPFPSSFNFLNKSSNNSSKRRSTFQNTAKALISLALDHVVSSGSCCCALVPTEHIKKETDVSYYPRAELMLGFQ